MNDLEQVFVVVGIELYQQVVLAGGIVEFHYFGYFAELGSRP